VQTQQQQESQTQGHEPKRKGFSRKQRIIATLSAALLVALAIATVQVLSNASLIPGIWAAISSAVVGVFGTVFAFLALLPLLFPPDAPPSTPVPATPILPLPQLPPHSPLPSPTPLLGGKSASDDSGIIWTVPYRRNPFFTGRETVLTHLHTHLTATRTAALTQPQAISGLGGIGKTHIAVEYAYRHQQDYRAVLWVNAATRETVIADYVTLAARLQLPEKDALDQTITVAAVKHWLENTSDWLLIFDNADDLVLVEDFLPVKGHGHLLLTTRAQAPGTLAKRLEVQEMDTQEGTLLLLRRANVLAPDAPLDQASLEDRTSAEAIVHAMDGLPLVLDQAGAYIEETACGLTTYLERYQHQPMPLLERRGVSGKDHPLPVAKTWSLSFGQVERQSPAAADLLRLCAFLAPDAIPEELMVEGASELTPLLQSMVTTPSLLDEAIALLRRFSLLRRNPQDHTLSVHRLVQAVLRASLSEHTQQAWAERTVRAVNQAFPTVSVETWSQCQHYLPHAQTCADLITQYDLAFPEAAHLLNQAAGYLYDRGLYTEAEPLYQRALAIREQVLGANHPDTATSLNNLAELYRAQGKYEQAEPLYQRALAILEQVLGANHPHTATSLNNLAGLYDAQGKYEQAEPLYQRALHISEQVLGANHPDTATSLNNLALLYRAQGKYEQAEPLLERALHISKQALGANHPDTAGSLNNLAELYHAQGKYEQAEPLYQRALAVLEQALGARHPDTVTIRENYAGLLQNRKQKKKGQR
jgi:tetratricopeptide (TPR) repeat protein